MVSPTGKVLYSVARVQIYLSLLKQFAKDSSLKSPVVRFGSFFKKLYILLCMSGEKRTLGKLITSYDGGNPRLFLEVGGVLHSAGALEKAKFCFNQVIILQKDGDDQNTRLLALMGKLE